MGAKVVSAVIRKPIAFSSQSALIDIDPALAIVRGGVVKTLPDASLSRAPYLSDLLSGAGGFANLTGWTQNGSGTSTIVDGQLVILVDETPIVVCSGGNTTYTENGSAVNVDSAVALSGPDTANAAVVAITGNLDNANDALTFANQLGITGSYNSTTGVMTLTGFGVSLSNWQTALRAVKFATSGDDPATSNRTVTFTVDDSSESTKTVAIAAVNDAPVITCSGGTVAFTEDAGTVVIDSTLTITDADNSNLTGATIDFSSGFQTTEDTLAGTNQNGITFLYDSGTGILSASGSATLTQYRTALRGVTYANGSQNPTTTNRVIRFVVTDGTTASSASTKTVTVAGVNDAPVVATSGGTTSYTENAAATAIDAALTVADIDNTNQSSATVTLTTNFVSGGEDVLSCPSPSGGIVVGTFNDTTGVLTLTGATTKANWQATLRAVLYSNSSDNPSTATRTASFVINDGTVNSSAATKQISVTAVNDAPVLVTSGGTSAYTENGSAVVVDGALTISDVDSGNITGGTVQITGNYSTGNDTLAGTDQNGITFAAFNSGSGTLTASGTATKAQYQTALRGVTFITSGDNPSTSNRTVTFQVSDGTASSVAATKTVSVAAVNDAPVNTVPGAQTIDEDTTLEFSVAESTAITVADVDNSSLTTTLVVAHGTLVPGGTTGLTVTGSGTNTLQLAGTVAAINTGLDGTIYTPTANYNGDDTLTVTTTDGALADVDTVDITIDAVEDDPIISWLGGGATSETTVNVDDTTVGTVTASDPDAGAVLTYDLAGGADVALFIIDEDTGALAFIDPAIEGDYEVIVRVTDDTARTDTQTVTVHVVPFAPPEITSDGGGETSEVTVDEGTSVAITTVVATGDGTIVYSLGVDHDEVDFSINGATGDVIATSINEDKTIELIATSEFGSDSQLMTVHCNALYGPPEGMTDFIKKASTVTPADTGKFSDDNAGPRNFTFETTPAGAAALMASFVGDSGNPFGGDQIVFEGTSGTIFGGVHSTNDNGDGTFLVNTWIPNPSFVDDIFATGETVTVSRRPHL